MRDSIMSWLRSLACFYLLLSTILHLVPQKKYEPYVRFFMGLLLIGILCTPLFALLGKAGNFLESFQTHYQSSMEKLDEEDALRMQRLYLKRGVSLFQEEDPPQE